MKRSVAVPFLVAMLCCGPALAGPFAAAVESGAATGPFSSVFEAPDSTAPAVPCPTCGKLNCPCGCATGAACTCNVTAERPPTAAVPLATITVKVHEHYRDNPCLNCDLLESDQAAMPWAKFVKVYLDDSTLQSPTLEWQGKDGKRWMQVGWSGDTREERVAEFGRKWLHSLTLSPAPVPVRVTSTPSPQRVVMAAPASPVVRHTAGHWTWPGDLRSHMTGTHGLSSSQIAGMSAEQLQSYHDALHEGRAVRQQPTVRYQYQQSGGCPGGACPTFQPVRRLFGLRR